MTMILDTTICSLSEYLQLKQQRLDQEWQENRTTSKRKHQLLVPERPRHCPECGKSDSFWVHSYWYRWAIDGVLEALVAVPRFECSFCTKVLSVLYAFLVPYRQFTVQAIAGAVEMYVLAEATYRKVTGELEGDNYRPAHSQVWEWVKVFVKKMQEFVGVKLQCACVESGKDEEELIRAGKCVCPNAENAASQEKSNKLNVAARALGMAELLLKRHTGLVHALQAYFVRSVQIPFSILTGRGIRLLTPQSSELVL